MNNESLVPQNLFARLARLLMILITASGWLLGQTPLRREHIRLGGRVIAIESPQLVTPASVRLKATQTTAFSAGGGTPAWSVVPASGSGTINSAGLYTAPATVAVETTVTVEARQTAGGTLIGTATVVLEPAALVITPSAPNLQASGSQDFTANMAVTWAISAGDGTLSNPTATSVHYTAPSSIPSTTSATLTATSTGNATMSGAALIQLLPASGVCTVNPRSLVWSANGPPQTVTLTCPSGYAWNSSNAGATWVTISPASGTGTGGASTITLTAASLGSGSRPPGTVMIDGTSISVQQYQNCTSSYSNLTLGSAPPPISLTTGCTAGVPWTASTGGATWLTLSPTSGTGPATVTLDVSRYTAAQGTAIRTATVTIQGNSFTVSQHPECSLNPTAVALRGGLDFKYVDLTCPTLAPWSTATDQGWVAATASSGTATSGTGSAILKIASSENSLGPARSATVTVDGKTIAVTQAARSAVTVQPTSQTLSAGGQIQFVGYIGGVEQTTQLTWSVASGPGSFITPPGLFQAPAVVLPTNNVATIQATDVPGGGGTTATVTMTPYSPAQGVAVAPTSGTALTQLFQFSVTNASGVSTTDMNALINASLASPEHGCAIQITPGGTAPYLNSIRLQANTGSGFLGPISAGTAGTLENSQCRVQTGSSSVTTNGNTVTATLLIEFKPGFTGQKLVGLATSNSTGAISQTVQVGTWNLSANVASAKPSVAITVPAANATVGGSSVLVEGWALDNMTQAENLITNVKVSIDGVLQTAPVSWNISNSAAAAACSGKSTWQGCPNAGWSFIWDTRALANGTHTISVVVTDADYPTKDSDPVTRTVTIYNAPATPITVAPSTTKARMRLGGGYNPSSPQFTAYRGSTVLSSVLWSTVPTGVGSVGTTGLYTPPLSGSYSPGYQLRVYATNPSDSTDNGYSWVTLVGILGGGEYLVSLSQGQTAQFFSSLGSVTYTLQPALGSITYYGLYTNNAAGYTPGTIVTVTATSTSNPNQQQTGYVRLQ